jgi:hypothetical protein
MLHNTWIEQDHRARSDLSDLLDGCQDERTVETADPRRAVQRTGLAKGYGPETQARKLRSWSPKCGVHAVLDEGPVPHQMEGGW